MTKNPFILGVILAGGQSTRMGRDKATVELDGKPLVDFVHERLSKQTNQVITNAPEALIKNITNIPDDDPDLKGPLAGLLAAFGWAEKNQQPPYAIVTVAVDTPFFPDDLVEKLSKDGGATVATHTNEIQPTCGFWPGNTFGALSAYRESHKRPSIREFAKRYNVRKISFDGENDFFNINTPEDLAKAASLI